MGELAVMRAFTSATVAELFAQDTTQAFLWLLTITTPDLPGGVVHVVNNLTNVVSRGTVFTAFPFTVVLPIDSEQRSPNLELRIDNVDLYLVHALRTATTPPTCKLEWIAASRPDTVEFQLVDLVLRSVKFDPRTVTFSLMHEDVMNATFPGDSYTPDEYPGLF
jgi:hypothetical protein